MAFKLTNEQVIELQNARNLFPDPVEGNDLDYALLYELLLGYIGLYRADNALTSAEAETVLWLEGAMMVNRNIGAQSDFIRSYNDEQSQLRYGISVSDDRMTQASDEIVLEVIGQIINGDPNTSPPVAIGTLPSISAIAESDAQPTAEKIFQGDPNPGGWAGNPLFLFLNYSDAYQTNIIDSERGTYDLLAMIKIMRDLGIESYEDDLGELVRQSSSVASEVDAGVVIAQAILDSEELLDTTYGEGAFTISSLLATAFSNIVVGSYGDDSGVKSLATSEHNDIAHGGTGDDVILGSTGSDLIDGAEGTDTIDYSQTTGRLTVTIDALPEPHSARYIGRVDKGLFGLSPNDSLYNVEQIIGSASEDIFHIRLMKPDLTCEGG